MSVYDFYRRKMNVNTNSTGKDYPTLGEKLKSDSDMVMELTWDNDLQSKVCYIYDYFHDDKPHLNFGMTYENTTKTKIDAKFIVSKYQSIDKEQVEYHLMFRPSQKTIFDENDELYYFEADYRKRYHNDDFVGLYIDIPDEKGNYRKWIIIQREEGNQFIKYLIIPCTFNLMWVETNGNKRIKRQMWCALRGQNSYNSGVYTYYATTKMENQDKCWMPLNSITEKIWYTTDSNSNMRVLVGAVTEHPLAWIISKVENVKPAGIQKLTFYQSEFNPHTDYVNLETGEMYADYYTSPIEPTNPTDPSESTPTPSSNSTKITASTSTIKIGGSYKTLSVSVFDENGVDITDNYSNADVKWTCSIDGVDFTENTDVITWLKGNTFNKQKIKFCNDRSYLQKILEVKCIVTKGEEVIEAAMQFELIV